MVSFGRLGKLRELSISPIIVASIYNHSTNRSTMTTNPFGSRLYDYIRTVLERPAHEGVDLAAGDRL